MRQIPYLLWLFNFTVLLVVNVTSTSIAVVYVTNVMVLLYSSFVIASIIVSAQLDDGRQKVGSSKAPRIAALLILAASVAFFCVLLMSVKYEAGRVEEFADPTSPYDGADRYIDDLAQRLENRLGKPDDTVDL